MRRLLAVVIVAVLAVAAGTIANHPGRVEIVWQGWAIDTSVGVLAAAAAIAALLLWLGFAAVATALRLPGRFRRNRRDRRRRAGEAALARGMIALAGGDAAAAQRHARRAGVLLDGAAPALLLAAQAARLAGAEDEATRLYTAMLDDKTVAFLGLRGLLGQALREGNRDEALRLAERARELRPSAGWAFEALLLLQTRAGQWQAVLETLAAAARHHLLPSERARHQRGVALHELSLLAEQEGRADAALSQAAEAADATPDLAEPACRHARLLLASGSRRRARRAVAHAWTRAPHPALARLWCEAEGAAEPLAAVGAVQRLIAANPEATESRISLAEAALAARLWGEARAQLSALVEAAGPAGPQRRVCLLMARLEEAEYGQTDRARAWLDRALDSPRDPAYVCRECGGESAEWGSLCPHCQGFDTLAWQQSPAGRPAVPIAAAIVLPDPAPPLLATAAQSDK